MPWEDIKKRSSNNDREAPEVILARIDENIKFLKAGAEVTKIALHEHENKDEKKFDDISKKMEKVNKTIWMVSGGAAVMIFFIDLIFKH